MQIKKEFEEFIEKLRKASKEKIVLVEGIKDKKALESLGIENIITSKRTFVAKSKKYKRYLTFISKI